MHRGKPLTPISSPLSKGSHSRFMRARIIGLTGSLAMGKSTLAKTLKAKGYLVFSADAIVSRISQTVAFQKKFGPKSEIKKNLLQRPSLIKDLEGYLHPRVRREMEKFLKAHARSKVVLDIPLLYENNLDRRCDITIVVTAPKDIQDYRIRRFRGMSENLKTLLLSRQMPDCEKRHRADVVIQTGLNRYESVRQLEKVKHAGNCTGYRNNGARPRFRTPHHRNWRH